MTIEEFIEARLADWERNAAEAIELEKLYSGEFEISYEWVRLTSRRGSNLPRSSMFVPGAAAPHEMLRQVAAIRAAMEFGAGLVSSSQQIEFEDHVAAPIAAIWSDHQDYQPEWLA